MSNIDLIYLTIDIVLTPFVVWYVWDTMRLNDEYKKEGVRK